MVSFEDEAKERKRRQAKFVREKNKLL